MAFLYALPGAVAEGLIWGLMGIGVYISYKILDMAELTVDGSICTGACVCAVLLTMGLPVWLCMLLALLAGMLSGVVTGLLHTALGIPSILAGILTQLMLYSVNLAILGGKSMVAINPRSTTLLVHMSNNPGSIAAMVTIVAAMIVILWLFFYTEIGLTLKSTGDNPDMSRAQGVDVKRNKVIGLAAIFIGLSVSLKIKPNFVCSLIGVIGGGIVYYIVYNFVILLGLKTDYLKMLSAIIVAVFLAVPYVKSEYFTKRKSLHPSAGGEPHA